ncbi:hypothetical protein [Candidatus Enterococcus mangumiae]|uniref:Uncharacterized protein n=1 Tax=Candidatus Enterococcus mangumiae TaxID=2230878 RepID=A0ABZ2SV54_9ENTE|nr:hypothetical protein [Enterococcus sp. DIV1094]MBO0490662.1 hypothetical protein [Enterococcus sp. DIV1094]
MDKKIMNVKIESEHGMSAGKSEIILEQLKKYIGTEYNGDRIKNEMQIFGEQKDILGVGWGYLYTVLPTKNNVGSFRIYSAYANVT